MRVKTPILKKEQPMDDSRIVELYNARSEAAISETSAKYGARLRRIALALGCDELTAEECENDVYLRAWEQIPPRDPRGYLFAFLSRLMRGAAIDRLRRESSAKRSAAFIELTEELAEILPDGRTVESEAEANELGRLINGYIGGLSEEKRALFIRRCWYFESIEELAESFGCSKGRVKTRLSRIRAGLAEYLRKEGYTV